jgi:hypothetical protein
MQCFCLLISLDRVLSSRYRLLESAAYLFVEFYWVRVIAIDGPFQGRRLASISIETVRHSKPRSEDDDEAWLRGMGGRHSEAERRR